MSVLRNLDHRMMSGGSHHGNVCYEFTWPIFLSPVSVFCFSFPSTRCDSFLTAKQVSKSSTFKVHTLFDACIATTVSVFFFFFFRLRFLMHTIGWIPISCILTYTNRSLGREWSFLVREVLHNTPYLYSWDILQYN